VRGARVADYDYELPAHRIARYPADRRDASRLLVVPRGEAPFRDRVFHEVVGLFEPGDVLVVNETRVLPCRLLGRKPTGAPAEILLLRTAMGGGDPGIWEALVRPGSKLKPGRTVTVAPDLSVEILDSVAGGGRLVRLRTPLDPHEALARHGHVPLPPYLGRGDEAVDRERYQTVYARTAGSVAAPTAGLHFTPELLSRIEARGVQRAALTLHVGVGTFRPVEVDDPANHRMHAEAFEIGEACARVIADARARGSRIWAVGTTVVRALESVADDEGRVHPGHGETDLFIRPPYRFRSVDALLTNFHLPRSTLLMLVAALGGYERVMDAYRHAIAGPYRFYSYGDAMALLPR